MRAPVPLSSYPLGPDPLLLVREYTLFSVKIKAGPTRILFAGLNGREKKRLIDTSPLAMCSCESKIGEVLSKSALL
jgi:hypothetical protein